MTQEERQVLEQAASILSRWREDLGAGFVVSVGAHPATISDDIDHVSVALSLGGEVYSGAAKYLPDAAALARAKYRDEMKRRENAREEGRQAAERPRSPADKMHEAIQ